MFIIGLGNVAKHKIIMINAVHLLSLKMFTIPYGSRTICLKHYMPDALYD